MAGHRLSQALCHENHQIRVAGGICGRFSRRDFPSAYDEYCRLLAQLRPLLIGGKVEENYGAVSVNIVRMRSLSEEW